MPFDKIKDNLCLRCRQRPRVVYPTGLHAYCLDCKGLHDRKNSHSGTYRYLRSFDYRPKDSNGKT